MISGKNFVAETKRNFDNHQLKQDVKKPVSNINTLENKQANEVEETKTEQINQPEENTLNTLNVSNTEDNFVYKKIRNEKILRSLLKNIETKPGRKLTDDEKKLLKGFYKKNNVTWPANTQSTTGVKNQLHKFKL